MADGVRSARAGIRHDHGGTGKTEMLLQVADLLMRGIAGNFGRQMPWFAGPNVAQEIFSMLHAASRRADAKFKP